jgi:hypothetical protein
MAEPPALRQRGSIFLYFSNENPSEIIPTQSHPTMKTLVDVFNSSKPLFEALSKKYADVTNKSELQYFKLQLYAHCIQIEYVILVHDVMWTLLGPYDVITSLDGDEDITWHTENNKPVLHVLFVCLNLSPNQLIKSNNILEQFCFVSHPIPSHNLFCCFCCFWPISFWWLFSLYSIHLLVIRAVSDCC